MRKKLFRNYYSKIITISVIFIVSFVSFALSIYLYFMNQSRIIHETDEQNKAIAELALCYDDIIKNRNSVYTPFFNADNMKLLQQFCREDYSVYDKGILLDQISLILKEVSQKDERIEFIFFRKLSEEKPYLYVAETDRLWREGFPLEQTEINDENYLILGGRAIKGWVKNDTKEVYGIMSKSFSSKNPLDIPDYQITIWYSLEMYDSILAKYNLDPKTRFLIVTQQGFLIYDSWGQYKENHVSLFEHKDVIQESEKYYEVESSEDQIKKQNTLRGDGIVLCVSGSDIDDFYFSKEMRIVIFVALCMNVLVVLGMFAVRRSLMKRFQLLESSMQKIGLSNLKYRMPVSASDDEFSRIAKCFNKMTEELYQSIQKNYVYHLLQYKAEYKALETKVNPHFLYNSLQVIYGMSEEKGQSEIAEVVMLLSRIFDYQIHDDNIVSIWSEMEAIQHYMDFLVLRYRSMFAYMVEFDEEILDYKIPKMVFLAMIEYYMKYGFRGDGTDFISVRGYQDEDGMIHVDFYDNGKGGQAECIQKMAKAIKEEDESEESLAEIINAYKRMKILCGEACRMEWNSNAPEPGVNMSFIFKGVSTFIDLQIGGM